MLKLASKLAALSIVATVLCGSPIFGEEFPWCVEADVFTKNCGFSSREECMAIARNLASPATGPGRCIANPNYQPPKSTKASAKTPARPHDKPR